MVERIGRPLGEKLLDLGNLFIAGMALGVILARGPSAVSAWALGGGLGVGGALYLAGGALLYWAEREPQE